ncbi:MAG TPA: glycosyltransferase family 9 protein [Myxococcota bacterium]|nr:glycosyltransferase family 9 protein [Myxococcota bacterium]
MLGPIPAERILVIRLGALGDVVRTRWAFAGLRALYPNARIDWLVEDRAAAGLVGLPGLSEQVVVPRRRLRARHPWRALQTLREFAGELRARRYDLSIDFHGVFRSAFLAWAAGIPVRVGYAAPIAKEASQWLSTLRAPAPRHVSRFERNAALVEFLGGKVPEKPHVLELDPALAQRFAGLPERFALVHPGTSPKTTYKRWEAERFAAVARALREQAGIETLVAFGPVAGEREAARAVVAAAQGAAALAPASESLAELLALLSRAQLFVGCDSGPMHLATLAGTPAVAIFGPTDPIENAPSRSVPSRVVRRDVGCNPCREGCPARTCMRTVEPAAVIEAALALL